MKNFVIVLSLVLLLCLPAWAQESSTPSKNYLYQVVLLMGDTSGKSELDRMPANVREALEDVEQFLPYASYTMLDSTVIRNTDRADAMMSGPDGKQMALMFIVDMQSGDARRSSQIFVENFTISARDLVPQDNVTIEDGEAKIQHQAPQYKWRRVLQTAFRVDPDETIVVGSSKLNGSDRALIALFTALP